MVVILTKILPPAHWLNSKVSGIAVAAAAAGIVVLWKKKLDQLSSKRYARYCSEAASVASMPVYTRLLSVAS